MNADCDCKLQTGIEKYGLTREFNSGDYNDYLVAKWRGDGQKTETGIRKLADLVNRKIIITRLTETSVDTSDDAIDRYYEALQSDRDKYPTVYDMLDEALSGLSDVSTESPAEELSADLIARSTVRRHLTKHLSAEKEQGETDPEGRIEWNIEHMSEQVTEVFNGMIQRDELADDGAGTVSIDVRVKCPEDGCHMRTDVLKAIKRGYICPDHAHQSSVQSTTEQASGITE